MRHTGIALLFVAMVSGFAAAAQAGKGPAGPAEKDAAVRTGGRSWSPRVVGEVTAISGNTLTLTDTIQGEPQVLVLTFDRATQFGAAQEGKKVRADFKWHRANEVTAADLQVGEQVKVYYIVGEDIAGPSSSPPRRRRQAQVIPARARVQVRVVQAQVQASIT